MATSAGISKICALKSIHSHRQKSVNRDFELWFYFNEIVLILLFIQNIDGCQSMLMLFGHSIDWLLKHRAADFHSEWDSKLRLLPVFTKTVPLIDENSKKFDQFSFRLTVRVSRFQYFSCRSFDCQIHSRQLSNNVRWFARNLDRWFFQSISTRITVSVLCLGSTSQTKSGQLIQRCFLFQMKIFNWNLFLFSDISRWQIEMDRKFSLDHARIRSSNANLLALFDDILSSCFTLDHRCDSLQSSNAGKNVVFYFNWRSAFDLSSGSKKFSTNQDKSPESSTFFSNIQFPFG